MLILFSIVRGEHPVTNECCMMSCQVDFAYDFCRDSCSGDRFDDGVNWTYGQGRLAEIAEQIGDASAAGPAAMEPWTEALANLQEPAANSCQPAFIISELLYFAGSHQPSSHISGSWSIWVLKSVQDVALLALAGWKAFFRGTRDAVSREFGLELSTSQFCKTWPDPEISALAAVRNLLSSASDIAPGQRRQLLEPGVHETLDDDIGALLSKADAAVDWVLQRPVAPTPFAWALALIWLAFRGTGRALSDTYTWQKAVDARLLKDRLRGAFELMSKHVPVSLSAPSGGSFAAEHCWISVLLVALDVCNHIAAAIAETHSKVWQFTWRGPSHEGFVAKLTSGGCNESCAITGRLAHETAAPVAVCIVGQPRSFSGKYLQQMAALQFEALCPLITKASEPPVTSEPVWGQDNDTLWTSMPSLSLLFVLVGQNEAERHVDAAKFTLELQRVLVNLRCPSSGNLGRLRRPIISTVDQYQDPVGVLQEEGAYDPKVWWHGHPDAMRKWVRQSRALARCEELIEAEERRGFERGAAPFGYVVVLRPDILHVTPVPQVPVGYLDDPTIFLPDHGDQPLSPRIGYIEHADRLVLMTRSAVKMFSRAPLDALGDPFFVRSHPSCLNCGDWRVSGAKLNPEKHLLNVLLWSSRECGRGSYGRKSSSPVEGLNLVFIRAWAQPLVLTEEGCLNARPKWNHGQDAESSRTRPSQWVGHSESGPRLPPWAQQLVQRHACRVPEPPPDANPKLRVTWAEQDQLQSKLASDAWRSGPWNIQHDAPVSIRMFSASAAPTLRKMLQALDNRSLLE